MLVLTRNIGSAIYIGKDKEIKVVVLGIQGKQVKIGIEAPREIPVIRDNIQNTQPKDYDE